MKKWSFLLLIVPVIAFGQHDFETRHFKIDATSLTAIPEVSSFDLKFDTNAPFQKKSLSDFLKVTSENYWQPVDMAQVLAQEESTYIDVPQIIYRKADAEESGFSVSLNGPNSIDGTNAQGIRNIAYKEMRSIFFCPASGAVPTTRAARRTRGFINSIW